MVVLTNLNGQADAYADEIATIMIPSLDGLYRSMEKPGDLI